jgi:hypothetical protein
MSLTATPGTAVPQTSPIAIAIAIAGPIAIANHHYRR